MPVPPALDDIIEAMRWIEAHFPRPDYTRTEQIQLAELYLLQESRHGKFRAERSSGAIDLPPEKLSVTVRPDTVEGALADALKSWRSNLAKKNKVPPYTILHDRTLLAIAELQPTSDAILTRIRGIGPHKAARFGPEILEIVAAHRQPTPDEDQPKPGRMQQLADAVMGAIKKSPQTREEMLALTEGDATALNRILAQAVAKGRVKQQKDGRYRYVKPKS